MSHEWEEDYHVEETEVRMPPTQPFYFDPERKLFIVGFPDAEKLFNPGEMEDLAIIDRETFEGSRDINLNTPETLVKITFDTLVLMGSGREFLMHATSKQKSEILRKAKEVMLDTYHLVDPTIPLSVLKRGAFTTYIQGDGTFHLRTFGNCSCLGPLGDGGRVYYPEERTYLASTSFPVALADHNLDTKAQLLSIYAGAGTIGWLTRQMVQRT